MANVREKYLLRKKMLRQVVNDNFVVVNGKIED